MAVQWVFLGAKDRDTLEAAAVHETFESGSEEISLREAVVLDFAVVVAGRIRGARSELAPEEDVLDALRLERVAERRLAELWRKPAVRDRPDISDCRHDVRSKEAQEHLDRVIGVADGEDPL